MPGILWRAIRKPDFEGPVNAVAPEIPAQREFARLLGKRLKRPALAPLPAAVVRILFGEMGNELLLGGTAVLPERLLAEGFAFRFGTLERAFEDLLP